MPNFVRKAFMVDSFQKRYPAETSSLSDFLATVRKRRGKIVSLDRVSWSTARALHFLGDNSGGTHAQLRPDLPGFDDCVADVCRRKFGVLVAEALPVPPAPRRGLRCSLSIVRRAGRRGSSRVRPMGNAASDGGARGDRACGWGRGRGRGRSAENVRLQRQDVRGYRHQRATASTSRGWPVGMPRPRLSVVPHSHSTPRAQPSTSSCRGTTRGRTIA
jgi:hypothetical protein